MSRMYDMLKITPPEELPGNIATLIDIMPEEPKTKVDILMRLLLATPVKIREIVILSQVNKYPISEQMYYLQSILSTKPLLV